MERYFFFLDFGSLYTLLNGYFPVVIGLDFLFFSGMQIDVMNRMYWFQDDKKKKVFQKKKTKKNKHHEWTMVPQLALFSAIAPYPTESADVEAYVKFSYERFSRIA